MKLFLFFTIFAFRSIFTDSQKFHETDSVLNQCFGRCHRLLTRTLSKINYSIKEIDVLFKSNQRVKNLADICWKFYDFHDCENQCEKRPKRSITDLDLLAKNVIKKCKFVDEEASSNIRCIHKYHSFLEVRCLSYMNEAVKLRKLIDETDNEKDKTAKVQETCRFLHYHDMCLSNTVFYYCPNSKKLYNGFTLKDYFLSFVVPDNDEDFPDNFLDYCQIFDFQKIAKNVYDTTSSIKIENMNDHFWTTTIIPKEPMPMPNIQLLSDKKLENVSKSVEKKVFASEKELQETPPNFFYSSVRYETTTYNPVKIIKKEERRSTKYPIHLANHFWYPEPVTIEFISNPIDSSEKSETSPKTDETHGFTLDPNQLISTIFKIPSIFPTSVTKPDIHPSEVNYRSATVVNVKTGIDEQKDQEFEEKKLDFEVIWNSRSLNSTIKNEIKKLVNNQKSPNLKNKTENLSKNQIKSSISNQKINPSFKENLGEKRTVLEPQENFVIKLLSGNSSEIDQTWREIVSNSTLFSNSSESFAPVNEDYDKNTNLHVSTYSEPSLSKTTAMPFEISTKKGPLLSGTKIHIKRIRHFSELEKDSDNVEDELIDEHEKPHIEIVKIPIPKVRARIVPSETLEDTSTKSENFWTSVIETEIENIDSKTDLNLFEVISRNISSMTAIKWFIILYSSLFVAAFLVLVYLVISIIVKKCKKRGKYVLQQ